jgi:hypothetical protein
MKSNIELFAVDLEKLSLEEKEEVKKSGGDLSLIKS